MPILEATISFFDACVVLYMAAYFAINLAFVLLSHIRIGKALRKEHLEPAMNSESSHFLPHITLLVPAYNEEVTIAESVRSLLRLRYPSYEIIICNDGSKDKTVDVLRRAFHFVRTEIEYESHLACADIRAFYESRMPLPPGLKRLLLIDKSNGGKADALNAAINAAQGDFVTSMDADSLLTPDALLLAARPIADDPGNIVAVGVQVGISNGSVVENGRVVEMRLPKSWLARFQIVEYMRSFAQGRVAFAMLDSLLILSGVFALMRRDMVLAIGGFLTKGMRTRIGVEYCGEGAHTVCEDMEIVVRLHRFLFDRRLPGRIEILPFATAWTECPENMKDLGKQRGRWYRGLLEVLVYHRAVLFRPRFRQIGLFSMPYQLFFEALAPQIEILGYVSLVITLLVGVLSIKALLTFMALALALNFSLSTLSILLCIKSERAAAAKADSISLFSYKRVTDILLLFVAGFVANLGYRQYLVGWQIKGFYDFLKGKKGWDKFARKGFAAGTT